MNRVRFLVFYRFLFGMLGLSAVITEISTLLERNQFAPANFFSYFTIESNIFAICIFFSTLLLVKPSKKQRIYMQLLRGASVLYMVMTGVIFAVLLAGIEGATLTAVPWDNIVLHYIMPVAVLVDWLIDTPKSRITFRQAWVWLLFPIFYVIYSLIRGAIVGWYPYPFLNPAPQGYPAIIMTAMLLALGVIAASWALCLTTRNTRRIITR